MDARAKFLGHPVHQLLIPFPVGLLVTAVVFDVIHLVTGAPRWSEVAYWMMAAGLVGALVAAPFGTMDWTKIPAGTRAKRVGALHGVGNVIVVLLYGASWWLRSGDPGDPAGFALVLSFAGLALAGVTAWLGGELVARLGVGVHEGAHLDAPSSLSGRPAGERAR